MLTISPSGQGTFEMKPTILSIACSTCFTLVFAFAVDAADVVTPSTKKKPAWQYESGEIQISIPTEDEARVMSFDAENVKKVLRYLDDGAVAWLRERKCVACHSPGAYMVDRPMLTKQLGKPSEEVLAAFISSIDDKPRETKEKQGITFHVHAERAVWRAAGLVQWDKHVTGKTSEHTDRALRVMLLQQSSHGGYYMPDAVEIPYETTDFELTQHAARALVEAPGWLANVKDPELLQRIDRLKQYLRKAEPRHDYDRALRVGLSSFMPDVVSPENRNADIEMLWSKQHQDGGWSTRDMSDVNNWSEHMTDIVVQLIEDLPDAADPQSDAYMTALAICLLRESGAPAEDARIQRGIFWLKSELRVTGRWWMHSLYRGNYHFSTYIATSKAMQALAMCDAIPEIVR